MKARGRFWVRSVPGGGAEPLVGGVLTHHLAEDHPTQAGGLSVDYVLLKARTWRPGRPANQAGESFYVPLAGELELIAAEDSYRLGPGSLLHLQSGTGCDISAGTERAAFFVVGLSNGTVNGSDATPRILRFDGETTAGGSAGRQCWESVRLRLVDGSSLSIGRFRLAGGYGYPVHSHDHDLLLLLLHGRLHGIGHDTLAPAAIYYPAGCPHGASSVPDGMECISVEIRAPFR